MVAPSKIPTMTGTPVAAERRPPAVEDRSPGVFAAGPVLGIAAAVVALLLAVAGRYGYHRDELYFLVSGHHLAWGYPDQPPLAPLLARLLSDLAPGSVTVLRTPSALAAGAVVVLAALSARELGAGRSAQVLAAATLATGAVLLGVGHLLSTATFYVLVSALLFWLVLRVVRTGRHVGWLGIGLVAGIGLLDSDLVAFVMAGIVLGLAVSGPRQAFRSPWIWVGGVVALAMWAPYLAWQAHHGWPELAMSRSIAAGNSGTSQPRSLLLPEQLVMLSPYLAPVWVAGLVLLVRAPALRRFRWVAVAYAFLAVVFVATGGKTYYLAGTFPVLVGAGAQPAVDWVRRRPGRSVQIGVGVALSAVGGILGALPVVPLGVLHDTPIVSINYDIGETVGWPGYVAQVSAAYRRLPSDDAATTAIVTSNYGEAGAIDRYGPTFGLASAYSVQNGFWYWGPPPSHTVHALAVGFTASQVARFCSDPVLSSRLANRWQVKDQEAGAPVWWCGRLRGPWAVLWPGMKVIG